MKCPTCSADVAAGARFCQSCGHELVVVGDQRRIATVLFADLVGFTSLSEQLDPEQVKALVDSCFERLAHDIVAFGGRVDKVIGDAIVALFGAPVAHEDDAERAVRAGLRMQETIAARAAELGQDVRMRVGINTGEVLVGAVRGGREYTAMGDVVNTASRLQEAAEPGTVLVGPDTRAATEHVIEYAEVDPVLAKGKALPVEASVARQALVAPGQRTRSTATPLVGRETELSLLTSVASTAIDRTRAAMLLINGEAGMGKSRLVSETAAHAKECLGAVVLEGRCVPYGEANVWWPVAEAVRSASQIDAAASASDVDAALRRVAAPPLRDAGRLDELDRVVDGLHHLLGGESSLRGIDIARARDEVVRSVVAVLDGYTQRRPVVVVLSDLHWAEQEVLELIDTLLARLARRPFVLMATSRRSLAERWHPAPEAANCVVLHLDPLSTEASTRLLDHLTEGSLDPAVASAIVDRSGGNPFYLEELASLLSQGGVPAGDADAGEAGALPTTLRGLVAARLDALPPRERQMLDDASVLGRHNWVSALARMAEVKRHLEWEDARSSIDALAAKEFLVIDGDTYSFRSDVIRDVAYGTLTKADRARSHAGIASYIENHHKDESAELEQVANHWASAAEIVLEMGSISGVPDDVRERAVASLVRAIAQAASDGFPASVEATATRALALLSDGDPERLRVLRRRAEARVDQFKIDVALADLDEADAAARVADDQRAIAENAVVRSEALQARGAFDAALACLDDATAAFDDLGHEPGRAKALRVRGRALMFAGDYVAADEALTEALRLYEKLGDRGGAAWALQNLSWSAYVAGRIEEAEHRVTAAMDTFTELGDHGGLTWSRGLLAWVRFHQGREEEAELLATEVGRDARERGEVWGEAMMVVLESSIALWSGRTVDAVETAGRANELFDRIDDTLGANQALAVWARAMLMAGDIDEGVATLRRALHDDASDADRQWLFRIATLTSAVQLGDVELGIEAGVDQAATAGEVDVVGNADKTAGLAVHLLQRGDFAGARRAIEGCVERRGFSEAAWALVRVAEGDLSAALEHAESVAVVPHTYLDQAFADIATALVLARRGAHGEAQALLNATIASVDLTQDRVAQAVVRLADAIIAEAGELADADRAREVAEIRLGSLGMVADGWRTLLRTTLGLIAA